MCCVFAVIALVWSALFGAAGSTNAPARAPAAEGCVAAAGFECSYVATQPGRYLAAGSDWIVTVVRPSNQVLSYQDGSSPNYMDAIHPGDRVTASAGAGVVRVGARPPAVSF